MSSLTLTITQHHPEGVVWAVPPVSQYYQFRRRQTLPPAVDLTDFNPQITDWEPIFWPGESFPPLSITGTISWRSVEMSLPSDLSSQDYRRLSDEFVNRYLKPNRFIDGRLPEVKALLPSHLREQPLAMQIQQAYDLVLTTLTYGKPIVGLYSCQEALATKETDCGGFSTLLGSLLQALDIPNRLVVGFLHKRGFKNTLKTSFPLSTWQLSDLTMHAWLEILLPDGSWLPADASTDWRFRHHLSPRRAGLGFTAADRLVISYGCDHLLKLPDKRVARLDILQDPRALTTAEVS